MSDIIEVVKNLKENVNLMEYASTHYGFEFKDSGGNLVPAECKLNSHGKSDSAPSFMYYRDSNSYYCHGCKEGGGIIEFVADMEGFATTKGEDFIDIVKLICTNEGIECNFDTSKSVDPAIAQELERRTLLAIKYRKELWDNKDSQAFQYLLSRGFTEKTIINFALGVTAANESKFGLANISNRIVFPILNAGGKKVIAFSFRTLDDNDTAKYINSVTDNIFKKGEIFYGWSHAIETMKKSKHAYVVEGYCDMISMHQIGLKNSLAMMTNRMTEEQIALLSKYVKNVTLVLDQDEAGMRGFNDTIIMMLKYGLNVKVVTSLGYQGKDINDACIKLKWDAKAIEKLIAANSTDAAFYKVNVALDKYDERMLVMREQILKISNIMTDSIQDPTKKQVLQSYVEKRLGMK